MTRFRHRSARIVVAGVALAAVAPLAACGTQKPQVEAAMNLVVFDQALHDRLPADIRKSNVVRVAGGGTSYPPAVAFASDGRTLVGFEPDLAAALGKVLGVKFDILGGDFATHLDRLQQHSVDAVLDSMTDTPQREKVADYVNYFSAGTSIVVQRGNPQGVTALSDLCGRVVAVQEATTQLDLLERTQKGCGSRPIILHVVDETADALVQLRTGRAVAVLSDYPPAVSLATDPSTSAHYQLASSTQYEPSPYGIAVAKDRTELRDVIRDALDKLIQSGAYADIMRRWNVSDGLVRSASVNGGGGTG